MPIKQHRMLNLINAAVDALQAYDTLVEAIKQAVLEVQTKQTSLEEAFNNLALHTTSTSTMLEHSEDTRFIIRQEHFHFLKNYKRNDKEAEARAKSRAHIPRREYTDHMANLFIPESRPLKQIPRPPGMNRRGDLSKSHHLPDQDTSIEDETTINIIWNEMQELGLSTKESADLMKKQTYSVYYSLNKRLRDLEDLDAPPDDLGLSNQDFGETDEPL